MHNKNQIFAGELQSRSHPIYLALYWWKRGESVGAISAFPSVGYSLITIANFGWIWTVLRKPKA
jgi:hypothetical protein